MESARRLNSCHPARLAGRCRYGGQTVGYFRWQAFRSRWVPVTGYATNNCGNGLLLSMKKGGDGLVAKLGSRRQSRARGIDDASATKLSLA